MLFSTGAEERLSRQAKVTVWEWEEGIEIQYKGEARPHREIVAPQAKSPVPTRVGSSRQPVERRESRPRTTHRAALVRGKETVLKQKGQI